MTYYLQVDDNRRTIVDSYIHKGFQTLRKVDADSWKAAVAYFERVRENCGKRKTGA